MTASRVFAGAAVALSLAAGSPVQAATTRLPGDFRPVAAEGSARAAWVNPSGIGSSPWQSLVLEITAVRENGEIDILNPAALSVAASTGQTAYAFRYEFDDVAGVPDWAVIAAKRARRRNGSIFGSALEWRGGQKRRLDATFGVATMLTRGVRASVVLEDAFAAEVDGTAGSRRWRGGLALRPPGGEGVLSWDYDRLESDDEGRHWFAAGFDRTRKFQLLFAMNDLGHWSVRAGIRLGSARWGGAFRTSEDTEQDPDVGVASMDVLGEAVHR